MKSTANTLEVLYKNSIIKSTYKNQQYRKTSDSQIFLAAKHINCNCVAEYFSIPFVQIEMMQRFFPVSVPKKV